MRMSKGLYLGVFMLLAVLLAGSAFAQNNAAPPAAPGAAAATPATPPPVAPPAEQAPPVDKGKMSYAIGLRLALPLKDLAEALDREQVVKGFNDQLDGKIGLSDEEIMTALKAFSQFAMAKGQELQKKAVEENTAEEQKFLAENGKKEGVVTLPSGLQYKVVKDGAGAVPAATDRVKVNYVGKFSDGKEFDSSNAHGGKPAELTVNGVIPAWKEALQLMKVGSKWELYVPSALGYGTRGNAKIPPAKMLLFEVELVEILPPAPAPEAAPGTVTIPPTGGQTPPPANKAPANPAQGSS